MEYIFPSIYLNILLKDSNINFKINKLSVKNQSSNGLLVGTINSSSPIPRNANFLSNYESSRTSSCYTWIPLTFTPISFIFFTIFLIFFYFKIIRTRVIPKSKPRQRPLEIEMKCLNRNSSLGEDQRKNKLSKPRIYERNKTLNNSKKKINLLNVDVDKNKTPFLYEIDV
jgi:hypothetical protein